LAKQKLKHFCTIPQIKALILYTGEKHKKFTAELEKYLSLEHDMKMLETQGLKVSQISIQRI